MTNAKGVLEWMEWKEREKKLKANMTNEEWFCLLSTEEKADLLSELVWWIHPSVQGGRKVELTKESFLRWLKEKHE